MIEWCKIKGQQFELSKHVVADEGGRPRVYVTWDEAAAKAASLGGRLPLEWELAAAESRLAYYQDPAYPLPELPRVDDPRLPVSDNGVVGLTGLVYCWCADTRGAYRVYRGGSWYSGASLARLAGRDWGTPSFRNDYLGFRLARDTPSPDRGEE